MSPIIVNRYACRYGVISGFWVRPRSLMAASFLRDDADADDGHHCCSAVSRQASRGRWELSECQAASTATLSSCIKLTAQLLAAVHTDLVQRSRDVTDVKGAVRDDGRCLLAQRMTMQCDW